MRIVFICLAATVLAFGIGLLAAKIYFKSIKHSIIAQTSEAKVFTFEAKNLTPNQKTSEDEEFDLAEQRFFKIIKPTIKKWLRGKRIRSEFTNPSDEFIKEITGKNKADLDERDINSLFEFGFEPALVDFNGDGVNELAVKSNCAMVGNCQFWIFRKKRNSYEIILKSLPGAVQTFMIEKSKSNSYFNIKTTDHGTASSGGIEIYKFDGKKYKTSECFDYNYSYLKNGTPYELKKPVISRRECNTEVYSQ